MNNKLIIFTLMILIGAPLGAPHVIAKQTPEEGIDAPNIHKHAMSSFDQLIFDIRAKKPVETITTDLKNITDINKTDQFGLTALHWAADVGGPNHGSPNIVALLLTQPGVNVNAIDKFGRSPLEIANERVHLAIVDLLLKAGGK